MSTSLLVASSSSSLFGHFGPGTVSSRFTQACRQAGRSRSLFLERVSESCSSVVLEQLENVGEAAAAGVGRGEELEGLVGSLEGFALRLVDAHDRCCVGGQRVEADFAVALWDVACLPSLRRNQPGCETLVGDTAVRR